MSSVSSFLPKNVRLYRDFQNIPEGSRPCRFSRHFIYHVFSGYHATQTSFYLWIGLTTGSWTQGFAGKDLVSVAFDYHSGTTSFITQEELTKAAAQLKQEKSR